MRIRRATGADAETVAALYLRSRRGAGDAIPPGVHPDDDVHRYVRETVIPEREAWVAVDPARRFYEARGWRAVRETDGDNEEGAPDVRYVWGAHPEGR